MSEELQSSRWPLPIRVAVLMALMIYLIVMVWAPLTTPSGAPHLTTHVENWVAPAQHALFLRHGYRFFAPDPGPTHALVYEIESVDGDKTEGHFPDRDNTTPRLLYHRWFMLSETLFREASQLQTPQQIQEGVQRYNKQIEILEKEGEKELSQRLAAERDAEMAEVDRATARCESMLRATARVLLKRHRESQVSESTPKSIRLWIQIRDQPHAEESVAGMELTDPILISRIEVGFYQADELMNDQLPTDADPEETEMETIAPMDEDSESSDE